MKFRLLLTAALLASASLPAQTLIHYYDFSSGVTDLVGTDDGTLMNGATVSGGMLNLDGTNDFAQFNTQLVPTGGADFSVVVYALANTPLNLVGHHAFLGQGNYGVPAGFFLGYHNSDGNFRVGDPWEDTFVPYPADGRMHAFTITYDGNWTKLYIDGSLMGTHSAVGDPIPATADSANTIFGAAIYGTHEFFNGSLDSVRIYSGALSAGQAAAFAVPEPSTSALAAAALALGAVLLRRRRAVVA